MKVYKFRSLGDRQSVERAQQILETGEFWCSRFWELNDPMEGYYQPGYSIADEAISQIFDEKSVTLICSFSHRIALRNPLMWGYYANGFNGIAIEVEVERESLLPITYSNDFRKVIISGSTNSMARAILGRKMKCWKHEREVRYLCRANRPGDQNRQIGTITGVVLGKRYPRALLNANRANRWSLVKEYDTFAEQIIKQAHDLRLTVQRAFMRDGRVELESVPLP